MTEDLWRTDVPGRPWVVRVALGAVRVAVVVLSATRDSSLNLRAMGLVYSTLLSLVPVLAVSFSLLKAFGAHYRIEPVLARALEPLGAKGFEVTRRVVEFVENMQVGVLGAVGVAGLLYTVLALLDRVEDSLNHIWHVRQARGLARKFTDYLSILLVGPVLVLAALAIIASAQSHWVVQRLLALTGLESIMVFLAGQVTPFVMLCGAFSFLYALAPNTDVRPRSALVGGAVAALLWQTAGMAFTAFIAGSTRYTAIYSGFAALVIFLIWLYVGWLIVLVGGQVAYFHQYPLSYRAGRTRHGVTFRERIALGALVELARRERSRQPPAPISALASTIQAPASVLEDLVADFVDRGVLLRAAEPAGVALARAPERITVAEILGIVHDPERETILGGSDPATAVLRSRDRAVANAVGHLTLAALVTTVPSDEQAMAA